MWNGNNEATRLSYLRYVTSLPLKRFSGIITPLSSLAFRLGEISYKIDEDVHDSSKVSDHSCGGEEQTIGHDLQVQLNAHKNDKHILGNLKQTLWF